MTPLSIDCRDGKHNACVGGAWDFERDWPATCACTCHGEVAA